MRMLRKPIFAFVTLTILTMVVGAMIALAQTPQPTADYVAPRETNDPYECTYQYVRGEIDERVYRDTSTRLIRFRSISPLDGSEIVDRAASLEEIAHYSLCEESVRLSEQTITSKLELQLAVDGEGNRFPEWLLIQAQNAQTQGRVEDVILYMMLYHYIMADNPELFLAE